MSKRIMLPGGSFIEVDEDDPSHGLDEARERADQKRERLFLRGLEAELDDPDSFARDLHENIDEGIRDFLRPGESPAVERLLEKRARPMVAASLRRQLQAAAAEEAAASSRGTLSDLLGVNEPMGRVEDWE